MARARGSVPDTDQHGYDGRLEFTPFIMGQGIAFEAAIATHLATLAR